MTYDRSVVSPGTPGSSTNKTDRHDIAEILLKVALNIITIIPIVISEILEYKMQFLLMV